MQLLGISMLAATGLPVLVVLIRSSKPMRGRVAAWAAVGLSVGVSLGLSSSPVLAGAVAAAGALASAVLSARKPKGEEDRVPAWAVASMALAAVAGILIGNTLRVNDALSLDGGNLRERLKSRGFSAEQVELIMQRTAEGMQVQTTLGESAHATGLLAHDDPPTSLAWSDLARLQEVPSQLIEKALHMGDARLVRAVTSQRAEGRGDSQITEWIRYYLLPDGRR